MIDLKELIEREIERFLDWPGDNKSIVTTTSAKLFAEHVAQLYADHIADARKKVAPVRGEPVGEVRFEFGAPSSIYAELYSEALPSLEPGTKLYTTPQPAPGVAELQAELEQEIQRRFDGNEQASREHRADVEALVEALELAQGFLRNKGYPEEDPLLLGAINAALAAHREKKGEV